MSSVVERLYHFFASLRCAVIILLAIAGASIIGTLIPQGMTEEAVLATFGETSLKARAIILLGLTDIYHALWFQALIALLALNVSLCTAERFPKTLKLWVHEDKDLQPDKLRKFSNFREFTSHRTLEEVAFLIRQFFKSHGWKAVLDSSEEGSFQNICTKREIFQFSIYGVHFSVILILLGAFAGSLFGFKGTMAILQGDSTNVVKLMQKDKALILPFELRCDKFEIKFYPDGTPSEYISEVTIVDNGQEVMKSAIKVNEPLTYRGVSFYQATYGTVISRATVTFADDTTGESFDLTLTTENEETVPGTNTIVQLMDYRENFGNFGPAVAIGMLDEDEKPQAGWILVNYPNFHGNRLGHYRLSVRDVEATYYTGLQVKRDPGIWLVLVGFAGLVLFMIATFYGDPMKLWCLAKKEKESDVVRIYVAMRSKGSAQHEKFSSLCQDIEKLL
jgi:cytochrome c biogenesis protein